MKDIERQVNELSLAEVNSQLTAIEVVLEGNAVGVTRFNQRFATLQLHEQRLVTDLENWLDEQLSQRRKELQQRRTLLETGGIPPHIQGLTANLDTLGSEALKQQKELISLAIRIKNHLGNAPDDEDKANAEAELTDKPVEQIGQIAYLSEQSEADLTNRFNDIVDELENRERLLQSELLSNKHAQQPITVTDFGNPLQLEEEPIMSKDPTSTAIQPESDLERYRIISKLGANQGKTLLKGRQLDPDALEALANDEERIIVLQAFSAAYYEEYLDVFRVPLGAVDVSHG